MHTQRARILFVDDEPRVLEGIENLLFDAPEDWETDFAGSGEEALQLLSSGEYDVLVTDMRMPGMDGAELLERAKSAHPSVVRIVLSGHTEAEAAQRALPLVHEFLSKPCSAELLIDTLSEALRLTRRFTNMDLRRAIGRVGSLPARPETFTRVDAAIAAEASLEEIAAIVSSDLGVTTKVLRVANTAFYSRARTVSSVDDAVRVLGSMTTRAVVLAVEALREGSPPAWFDLDALHQHSLSVGTLASQLVSPGDRAEALLGGLLHDVGKFLIATYFDHPGESGGSDVETELVALGFDHADIGAHLMRLWHLSPVVADAVERHHRLDVEERTDVDLAVFAAEWAHERQDDEGLGFQELGIVQRARVLMSGR